LPFVIIYVDVFLAEKCSFPSSADEAVMDKGKLMVDKMDMGVVFSSMVVDASCPLV